jgi:hypothetical protein
MDIPTHAAFQSKSTVAQQREQIETVIARVEEQTAQIQNVKAQIEMNKPVPQLVLNQ